MTTDEYIKKCEQSGISHARLLPTGEWAGLFTMLFTVGLVHKFVNMHDGIAFETRYCFEKWDEALKSLEQWDGKGFPPGWWIKQKPEDIPNPRKVHEFGRG